MTVALTQCSRDVVLTPPIAAHATVVAESTHQTANSANQVVNHSVAVNSQITNLKQEVEKGRLEAERLKKIGAATKAELEANAARWTQVATRNQILEDTNKQLLEDAQATKAYADRAAAEAEKLRQEADKKDQDVQKLQNVIAKQATDVALGRAVRRAFWSIVIISVIVLVLFILIKFTSLGARIAARLP